MITSHFQLLPRNWNFSAYSFGRADKRTFLLGRAFSKATSAALFSLGSLTTLEKHWLKFKPFISSIWSHSFLTRNAPPKGPFSHFHIDHLASDSLHRRNKIGLSKHIELLHSHHIAAVDYDTGTQGQSSRFSQNAWHHQRAFS